MVRTEFCQEYVGIPLEAVNVPFVSTQTAKGAHVFTVIEIELEPHANVYVITKMPGPETAGLKTPDAFTPVPLQVPPAVAAVNVTEGAVAHFALGTQTVASHHVIANGTHAEAAKDCTPPERAPALLLFPVPPQATTSPAVLTLTS